MQKIDSEKVLPVATILDGSPACATCPYFKLRADLQADPRTVGAGECRRFPPKVFYNQVMSQVPTGRILPDRSAETVPALGYTMQMASPLVQNTFFCGEHPELRADAAMYEAEARLEAIQEILPKLAIDIRTVIDGGTLKSKMN